MPYLTPDEFFKKHESSKIRIVGKQYGGHVTDYRAMMTLDKVISAMKRCGKDYTIENANCDSYHQKIIKVAGGTSRNPEIQSVYTELEFDYTVSSLFKSYRTDDEVMAGLLKWLGAKERNRLSEEEYQKYLKSR